MWLVAGGGVSNHDGWAADFALGVVLIILFYKIKSESGACR